MRLGKVLLFMIVLGLAAATLVGVASLGPIGGPPFQMAFQASATAGGTVVRFERSGGDLISPDFPVTIPAPPPARVVLDGSALAIPGCTIVFADTTLLPGRIQVRIGATLFDVMERSLIVAGKEFAWRPR